VLCLIFHHLSFGFSVLLPAFAFFFSLYVSCLCHFVCLCFYIFCFACFLFHLFLIRRDGHGCTCTCTCNCVYRYGMLWRSGRLTSRPMEQHSERALLRGFFFFLTPSSVFHLFAVFSFFFNILYFLWNLMVW